MGKRDIQKTNWILKTTFGEKTEFTLLGIMFPVDLENIINLNYHIAVTMMRKLFNAWKRHNLTPIRKINVVQTLAISKLNHLFITLPTPDKKLLKKLESLIYDYIWDGKPDKINRKKIIVIVKAGSTYWD